MNLFDLAIILTLCICLISGIFTGVIGELFSVTGVLIVFVLLLTFTSFLPKNASVVKNSLLASNFTLISEKMAMVVSKDMRHKFLPKINAYKKAWKNKE